LDNGVEDDHASVQILLLPPRAFRFPWRQPSGFLTRSNQSHGIGSKGSSCVRILASTNPNM
jgi:hypothetical protein